MCRRPSVRENETATALKATRGGFYSMTVDLTKDEEGKRVVDADGTQLGIVEDVRHGTAHVEAEPAVVEEMKTELGAGGSDGNTFTLSEDGVERIEDDEIIVEARG
jgi:sporulation protein YlmC with PRC-barrel domain